MSGPLGRIEFGGPDLPPRRLRDLLQDQVDRSPPGSRIDWATYYFRDRALADALIRASDRGVNVRLVMEVNTRRAGANEQVIAMLQAHGLNGGLYFYPTKKRGRLHSKVYAFSDPDIAWIGSFNPSGDEPEDSEVIEEIGDQDRGHNLLLGIERPKLTTGLRHYIDRLIDPPRLPFGWRPISLWRVRDGDTKLYFYPRLLTIIAELEIAFIGRAGRIRGAVSHLKKGPLTQALSISAKRGASIDLLVHDTERRVPSMLVARLREAGVRIHRVMHPDGLPMHAKFLLVRRGEEESAWLGSYNFNNRSRRHNAELLVRTKDPATIDALTDRFELIGAMAEDSSP